MLKLKNNYEYNSMLDILYITIKESGESYAHEDELGTVLNYDYETKELVGIEIWDFKAKMFKGKKINISYDIDFKAIYDKLN